LGAGGRRHRTQVERANFVVLRSPDVPSVLIEVGFISNPQDEQNLNNAQHRRKVADAIASGVHDHFMRTAPQGTWFAANRSRDRPVVERGDTLGLIAQRYQGSVNRLREANNLNGDVIHPGAVLVIPTGS
ncbi:MAG: N-acetylmuramoyl-L-alanine amidase, partial [Wenzhouxiangella sp.]|nr:N-acetylmuramoyl-L-alanine amidase [Wenzhouxiangella sp.]